MPHKTDPAPVAYPFFDRDLSWLSFNERVLMEAQRDSVPLMERIRFLAIYSSNLDEFYRVRMPARTALSAVVNKNEEKELRQTLPVIHDTVVNQQKRFGSVIESDILQALRANGIHLVYNEPIPDFIHDAVNDYFTYTVATFLQPVKIAKHTEFFPENNKLYLVVTTRSTGKRKGKEVYIVNIPSEELPRFYLVAHNGIQYILFLEDIIKLNLDKVVHQKIFTHQSIKITRDSDLNLEDEFSGNLAEKIEQRIGTRDLGFATRFLYEPGLTPHTLAILKKKLHLGTANFIAGGAYHNLKDLATLPLKDSRFCYEPWPVTRLPVPRQSSLFQEIRKKDLLLHPPYNSYETVLRFFSEAALDPTVKAIYVTLYRVAAESRIANALISAAKNGKHVVVFVELKARFDEANNIKWSKQMKAAGVRIIESIPGLKVHAKLALVKRKHHKKTSLLGLLATGNFNESTARFYTDHVLLTAHQPMLTEIQWLFDFLKKRKKRTRKTDLSFEHLLVGHFNLQERFLALIDREIQHAQEGKPCGITIKLNNLEERILIAKLYEASQAGVKIRLIVRGICCLIPGVKGISETITVKRIIDRYLEHGRIFVFENNGHPEVFMGSADWMIRNIYRRIEVCFPIANASLKAELLEILRLQLADNCQGAFIDGEGKNVELRMPGNDSAVRSQRAIAEWIQTKK
ncbi:polyphosphate kinase [Chryseolinea serpens]|uniref:Polyphosphate kinase n=1 Tax=Chryseolinea serpens TaxID=947013 RepID=A0A1M5URR2_9BACT|nr:polyphosphate kinase 1 [Chryseolinea serpens]SHH65757.1 polyphosphate kinase [Chryseolinea serpens]